MAVIACASRSPSPRIDADRLHALEAAIFTAAASYGFRVHGFSVFADHAGRDVPKITVELEQGLAPDPAKAAAWFLARGVRVASEGPAV